MLVTELGYFALLLAYVLSVLQVLLPTVGILRGHVAFQQLAPSMAWGQFLAMLLSFFGLMAGFYYNDFSLVYVAEHSNSLLPWFYKLSATWGGHEGSLLLWMTILAGWSASVATFSKGLPLAMRARVLVVLSSIQFMMLTMLIFSSSPFHRSVLANGLLSLPIDGRDLNPLLQDFGLIVHPPMLYMGYVGMAVPFAFCISALWVGQLDRRWTRWARPWALLAWGFLSLGIALGSWWAYYELGWGGWWFWDPVENASLLPWLACTALLHSLAVSEKRGVFKAWTIMLAIFAFALSLLGTFLVRSGVITSVHSFASDPTRGMMILLILAIVIGSGLLLFAFRGWRLTVESQFQLKSRETLLVINNIIILVAMLVVLLGTLYPIIADAVGWGQVSVGSPYFNALFVPLTWLLLLTMGVGSAIRWQADKRSLLRVGLVIGLMIVASSMVLAGVVTFFLQANDRLRNGWLINGWLNVALTLALSAWVLAWQLYDIKDKTKNVNHSGKQLLTRQLLIKLKKLPLSYWGMQTAHIGVLMIAIGVAVTTSQSIEKDVALGVGDKVRVQGYDFAMTDMYQISAQNYDATVAEIIVSKNGNYISSLRPEKRTYVVSMMPMTESAIDVNLWRDVYVALGEPIVLNKQTVNENQAQNQLTQHQSQQSEKWAVRIYVKPFVRWLWLGALVMVFGALLSLLDRRYRLRGS